MQTEMIPMDLLKVNGVNARKIKATGAQHDAMVASIKAHGLLHPLVVRLCEDGKYEVVDGGRRFAALKDVGEFQVPCIVREAGDKLALEVSATANMIRANMHPLDEADAIAQIMKDMPESEYADIAGRFGQTERWARQRHALSHLSKEARKLFTEGRLTLSAAQVLTTVSKEAQKAYLKDADTYELEAERIHDHFRRARVDAKIALFDLDLYPKEAIVTDLFGDEVWLTDRPAFDKLQTEALEKIVEEKKGEGWADVSLVVSGNHDWNKGLLKIEGRIKKADRAKLRCFVKYDVWSGKVTFDEGWASRKEASKITAGKNGADDTAAVEDVAEKTAMDLTTSQTIILRSQMAHAVEADIAKDAKLALFTIVTALLGSPAPWAKLSGNVPEYGMLGPDRGGADKPAYAAEIAGLKVPTFEKWMEMSKGEIDNLVKIAALNALRMPDLDGCLGHGYDNWYEPTERFLSKYRIDQLLDYAKRAKIDVGDKVKKKDLVDLILAAKPGEDFVPYKKGG